MLSRRSFLEDCSRLFRIFFKICWQIGDIVFWIFRKSDDSLTSDCLHFFRFLFEDLFSFLDWYLWFSRMSYSSIIIHVISLKI